MWHTFATINRQLGLNPQQPYLHIDYAFFLHECGTVFFFSPVSNVALFNAVTLCNKALEGTAQYVCSTTITGVIQSIGEVGYFVLSSQS